MTENMFWSFLKVAIAEKGRVNQAFGCMDSDEQDVNETECYIGGHSVLFNGHDLLSEDRIEEIGGLLFDPAVSRQAKEAILMILAHCPKKVALNILRRYNKNPDKELKYFAETALWECRIWNE